MKYCDFGLKTRISIPTHEKSVLILIFFKISRCILNYFLKKVKNSV